MVQTNKPDLVLSVACHGDNPRTWALDPQRHDSCRIVVRCQQLKPALALKTRSSFSLVSAIVHAVLPMLAFCRTTH
jgi:hypothetical protein